MAAKKKGMLPPGFKPKGSGKSGGKSGGVAKGKKMANAGASKVKGGKKQSGLKGY
jgi:hypothetical protein